jgi:hypothetical protein
MVRGDGGGPPAARRTGWRSGRAGAQARSVRDAGMEATDVGARGARGGGAGAGPGEPIRGLCRALGGTRRDDRFLPWGRRSSVFVLSAWPGLWGSMPSGATASLCSSCQRGWSDRPDSLPGGPTRCCARSAGPESGFRDRAGWKGALRPKSWPQSARGSDRVATPDSGPFSGPRVRTPCSAPVRRQFGGRRVRTDGVGDASSAQLGDGPRAHGRGAYARRGRPPRRRSSNVRAVIRTAADGGSVPLERRLTSRPTAHRSGEPTK